MLSDAHAALFCSQYTFTAKYVPPSPFPLHTRLTSSIAATSPSAVRLSFPPLRSLAHAWLCRVQDVGMGTRTWELRTRRVHQRQGCSLELRGPDRVPCEALIATSLFMRSLLDSRGSSACCSRCKEEELALGPRIMQQDVSHSSGARCGLVAGSLPFFFRLNLSTSHNPRHGIPSQLLAHHHPIPPLPPSRAPPPPSNHHRRRTFRADPPLPLLP